MPSYAQILEVKSNTMQRRYVLLQSTTFKKEKGYIMGGNIHSKNKKMHIIKKYAHLNLQ